MYNKFGEYEFSKNFELNEEEYDYVCHLLEEVNFIHTELARICDNAYDNGKDGIIEPLADICVSLESTILEYERLINMY